MTDYAGCYLPAHYEAARQRGDLLVLRDGHGIAACAVLHQNDERWPTALQSTKPAFYLHHLAAGVSAKSAGCIFLHMAEEYAVCQAKPASAWFPQAITPSSLTITSGRGTSPWGIAWTGCIPAFCWKKCCKEAT